MFILEVVLDGVVFPFNLQDVDTWYTGNIDFTPSASTATLEVRAIRPVAGGPWLFFSRCECSIPRYRWRWSLQF